MNSSTTYVVARDLDYVLPQLIVIVISNIIFLLPRNLILMPHSIQTILGTLTRLYQMDFYIL